MTAVIRKTHLKWFGRTHLMLDGEVVIDHWDEDGDLDRETGVSIPLTAGQPITIQTVSTLASWSTITWTGWSTRYSGSLSSTKTPSRR